MARRANEGAVSVNGGCCVPAIHRDANVTAMKTQLITRRHFLKAASALGVVVAPHFISPVNAVAQSAGVRRRGFQTVLLAHYTPESVLRLARLMRLYPNATAVASAPFFLPASSADERFANDRLLCLEVVGLKPLMLTEYFSFHAHDVCPDDVLAFRARQFRHFLQRLLITMRDRGIPRDRLTVKLCPMLEDNYPSEEVFRAKVRVILAQLPEALFDRLVIQRCGGPISAHRFSYAGHPFRLTREVHGPIGQHSAADSDVYSNDGGFVFIDKPDFGVTWNGRQYSVHENANSYTFEYTPPPAYSLTRFKELIANESGRTIMLWRPQYNGRVLGVERVRDSIVDWLENRAVPQQKLNIRAFTDAEVRCAERFLQQ